ncbi:MAG: DnaA regulatory inactivator Hda [Chromatiales bacterium]|jgi:DnaA family protein
MSVQLPLGITLRPRVDFSSYIPGRNAEAVARLRQAQDPFIYLWGGPGCGKSHLLQAVCRQQSKLEDRCTYVPLLKIAELQPVMLEGLEDLDLVCLDDLEQLAGMEGWELALFNLFNQLRERHARLLVTAHLPPARLPIRLPDLASRLTWGPCYHLSMLDDDGRLELLIRHARQRGLELSSDTAGYLLQRIPRDIHHLVGVIEQLDAASLAAQRRLTTPFVRKVLGL